MRKILTTILLLAFFVGGSITTKAQELSLDSIKVLKQSIQTKIDNMGYWRRMAAMNLVRVAPNNPIPKGKYTGSAIRANSVVTEDSPDIVVTEEPSTQSENSIFVDPTNRNVALNSNNSTSTDASILYGANDFHSFDASETWEGQLEGAGGANSGDPGTAISLDGRWYVGFIHSNSGQGVSYSTNQGQTWTSVVAATAGGSMLDKNHLWIDNSPVSPREGNVYSAWTDFGGSADSDIEIIRSVDGGLTWTGRTNISSAVNAGNHNQGVNIQTGPDGQVYAIWAIYDSWPSDESALGFAKSTNDLFTFAPATRIISNIRGIRTSETSKNHRVNSFPVMAVDISGGTYNGNIYVVWTNIGVPGVNNGPGIDAYMIRSTDEGATWSAPIRINQDPIEENNEHYFPWITCDPISGTLAVVFYDDRNVGGNQCEVFCAVSLDGGDSWEDFKVSDYSFTPAPIPGLAGGYMGDYLAISSYDRMVYPCWTDTRGGQTMTYVSPFETGPPPDQPWITYAGYLINDANANGTFDYAESAQLTVQIKNIGDQPATGVSATLSTTNQYITITDNSEVYGDFGVGEIIAIENAFAVEAAAGTPDGIKAAFDLTVTDGDSTWVSSFSIEIHSPALAAGSITISDINGNNNNQLDPGETADIIIEVLNPGDFDAQNTLAQIATSSQFLTVNSAEVNMGTVSPQTPSTATFNVTASAAAPIGTLADIMFTATSGLYSVTNLYYQPIGAVSLVEDFETGDFESFEWDLTGSANWVIDADAAEGEFSAKSGTINDNQSTEMAITLTVLFEGDITFSRKVSSENNYDYLHFFIDNQEIESWTGDVSWGEVSFPVQPGEHTFKWVYDKDGSVSSGSDCAWVDNIQFPLSLPQSMPLTASASAVDNEICLGQSTQLFAVTYGGEGTLTYSWDNAATLSDAGILNPIATPTETTTYTFTVTDGENTTLTAQVTITVNQLPVVNLGDDQSFCQGGSTTLNAGSFAEYLWSDGSTQPTLFVEESGTYSVTVVDDNGCTSTPSEVSVEVFPLPVITLGEDATIYYGETITLSVDGTFSEYLWHNGTTEATLTIDPYSVSGNSIICSITVTDENGCTATDEITLNIEAHSGIDALQISKVEVTPNPSNGIFNVNIEGIGNSAAVYEIYSIDGKLMLSGNLKATKGTANQAIDMTSFNKGVYILKVKNAGKEISTKIELQ